MKANFVLLTLLILTSCGPLSNLLAEKNTSPKLKGERISVFKFEQNNNQAASLGHIKVTTPNLENNSEWNNSNNSQSYYPENISLNNDLTNYKEVKLKNIYPKFVYLSATPIIGDNKIYILDGRGEIVCYSLEDLQHPIWNAKTAPLDEKEEFAGGGMAYHNKVIYGVAGHKDVVALNSTNGKEIWRSSLNNVIRAAPIVQGNILYVMTIDNKLYALEINSGSLLWLHEGASESVGIFGAASIAANDDTVIIPHSSGQLHALGARDGQEIWSVNLAYNKNSLSGITLADIDIAPVIKGDTVYIASNIGSLYAIDIRSGNLLWQKEVKGVKSFWVAADFIYVLDESNQLFCIYNINGQLKWLKSLSSYIVNKKTNNKFSIKGPIMAGNKLWLSVSNGKLLAISPFDGELVDEKKIPQKVNTMPIIVDQKLYLLSNDGTLAVWQ